MNNSVVKIGIICPCKDEYQICKKILKLNNETKLAGRLISSRKEKDIEVIAVSAGAGKIHCASASQLIINKFEPDFLFDVGASGSLSDKLSINDIVCAEHSFEYDVCPDDDLYKITDDLKTSTVLNKASSQEALKKFSNWVEKNMGSSIKIWQYCQRGERCKQQRTSPEAARKIKCNSVQLGNFFSLKNSTIKWNKKPIFPGDNRQC